MVDLCVSWEVNSRLQKSNPKRSFLRYLPSHFEGGLRYKLGFAFHVQSQIAVEALKRMHEI